VHEASQNLLRNEKELKAIQVSMRELVKAMPMLENQYLFTPEIMIQSSRDVVAATAGIVLATTQDPVLDNAKKARENMETLIKFARTAAEQDHIDKQTQTKVRNALQKAGDALVQLVDSCSLTKNDERTRAQLNKASNNVSSTINDLVTALRLLPDAKDVMMEETEDNLAEVAESELQKCARIIEEAAASLAAIKPRTNPTAGMINQDDLNDAILASARAIANATHKLMVSAEKAQAKRAASDSPQNRYNVDPTWANGLISAAQSVASSVKTLVGASNASVEGKAQEAALVASARGVAQSTAHLVAASKAKSDPFSPEIIALSDASKLVATSTSQLVEAAHAAAQFQEEEEADAAGRTAFTGERLANVRIMEQQMKVQKLEVELQKERRALAALRRAKYQK